MNYKSQDKELLTEFKGYLKAEVDQKEAEETWRFYNKHLYVNDLYKYLRTRIGQVIETGYGNYNASIVFVLRSLEDKKYIDFFKTLFGNIKVDFNEFFFTSFQKHTINYDQVYKEVIGLELKALAPQLVYTVGDFGVQADGFELQVLDKENFDRMLELMDKEARTDEENTELNTRKSTLWNQLKYIIKYYSV
jgi:hypothetical protein